MKVKVYAPAVLCETTALDGDNYLHLADGATVRDVYKALKIPFWVRKLLICSVNHKWEKKSKALKDGDVISFISPVAGG